MKHIARKRFGQHFLSDGGIIEAIVSAIAPLPVNDGGIGPAWPPHQPLVGAWGA